jgi:hypothetical protein
MAAKNTIGILSFGQAFCAAVLLAIGNTLPVPVFAADVPQEYVEAVRKAEADGLALYEAEQKGSAVEDKAVAEAKGQVSTFCDFSYKPVSVTESGQEALYLLGQAQHDNEMIVGGISGLPAAMCSRPRARVLS